MDNHGKPDPADWPQATCDWLGKLADDGISQKHLSDAWEQQNNENVIVCDSAWLDGGPTTIVKELRGGSSGITVLMEEDRPRVKDNRKELGQIDSADAAQTSSPGKVAP